MKPLKDSGRISLYLDDELVAQVRASAEENCRSLSKEVAFILRQYFKEHPLEGRESAD